MPIRQPTVPLNSQVSQVSKYAEDGKIALRNVRTDVMKKVAKAEFSKDAKKDLETDIQKTLDAAVKKVEEICKAKANDIMKL
ncbi:hypothetical protein FOA52_004259 [Chlamydomonas sp. UWO 241]|nr:hypothetical protein FOA52_004259 [Chlamydomonas sp. UWO 241]